MKTITIPFDINDKVYYIDSNNDAVREAVVEYIDVKIDKQTTQQGAIYDDVRIIYTLHDDDSKVVTSSAFKTFYDAINYLIDKCNDTYGTSYPPYYEIKEEDIK